jgi:hypothetical protein
MVLLFGIGVSLPAVAQGVGGIGGTVVDTSGAVLPGVTVTLSNPGTIGGNREAVTDAQGTYQFNRLVPGRYGVKAELTGFRPAAQENVVVNADATARVDLRLEIGQLQEAIVVKGESPLLDTTSALNQTVMSREVLDSLPARNDVWSIARMVTGVVLAKVDVGGSEAYLQSAATVHGSTTDENAFMVDGMDVSYTGGTGGVSIVYPDPFMYQEVNYQTANAPAERAKGGIIYNSITKTGTNVFRGAWMFTGANHGMGSDNYSPELRRQLLIAVPARVLAVNPNIVPGADILHMFDTAGSLSGPIVRDKLWFTASVRYSELDQYRLGGYDPNGALVLDDNRMANAAYKISWQATNDSQLSYLYNWHNKMIGHRLGSTDFAESLATHFNDKYMHLHQMKWTATLSPRMLVDVSSSLMTGTDPFHPQSDVQQGDIPRLDSVLRNVTVALPTYFDNPGYRGVFLSSLSYSSGRHDVKLGYQYMRAMIGSEQYSMSHYPAGLRAVFRNGAPDSVNTYNTPAQFKQYHEDHSTYVQDRWTPARKLTLNLGLRFETTYGWQPETCQVQTVFIQGQCFPAIEGAPDWKNLAPRFSAVYDLFGDGRTALKFSANRYNIPVGVANVARINPIRVTFDTRRWTDLNGDLIPQLTELGQSTGFNLGTTNRYSATLQRPLTNELSAEIQHQLPGDLVVSVGYYHRETRRNIGSRNIAVPRHSYIPLEVTEATSGRTVTVYNQDPALRGRFDVLWDNVPELDTTYDGVDISFNKRMSSRWMIMGGASVGQNRGDIYGGTSDQNNPNFTFRKGVTGNDVPFSIKASGVYQLPYGIALGASAHHSTGFPEITTVLVGGNTATLTQVTQSLVVEPRGTTRLPDIDQLDVSVRKTFRVRGLSLEPVLDVYNLANSASITARTTLLGPTYQKAVTIQRGRLIKLGMNASF